MCTTCAFERSSLEPLHCGSTLSKHRQGRQTQTEKTALIWRFEMGTSFTASEGSTRLLGLAALLDKQRGVNAMHAIHPARLWRTTRPADIPTAAAAALAQSTAPVLFTHPTGATQPQPKSRRASFCSCWPHFPNPTPGNGPKTPLTRIQAIKNRPKGGVQGANFAAHFRYARPQALACCRRSCIGQRGVVHGLWRAHGETGLWSTPRPACGYYAPTFLMRPR